MNNQPAAAISKRCYSFSLPRILLCSALLTVLIAACLYLYLTAFDFYHARFVETESKTLAWLTEQAGFALPFIVICLFHYLVYHKHDRRDGVASREMLWEVVIATALTYAILLPYLARISDALYINALAAGETIPETDGHVEITLLMELHEWIVRLVIPLGVLMVFHAVRAHREIHHPETEVPEESPITVEEYEARKAASLHASEAEAIGTPEEEAPNACDTEATEEVAHE